MDKLGINPRLREIYLHVRDHGGYVVGKRAQGALRVAKAAYRAEEIGLQVEWNWEEEPWMTFAGEPEEEYRKKFESEEWECLYAIVRDENCETLASLGGIVVGKDKQSEAYKECVEFELLAEAWEEVLRGERYAEKA